MTTPDNPQAICLSTPKPSVPAGPISLPDQDEAARQATSPVSGRDHTSPPANRFAAHRTPLPVVDPLLFVHVTTHGDLEQQRIASEHRLRILTTTEPDEDGVFRGFGLDDSHPDVARLAGITQALARIEHDAELNLKRALRRCGIHPWVKAQIGLGEKQVARLLGAVGDPYWHLAEDRPRTVSELWAYSGLHVLPSSQSAFDTQTANAAGALLPADQTQHATHTGLVGGNQTSDPGQPRAGTQKQNVGVAARRQKGRQANWSTDAKTRAYLCAISCLKQERSPYRAVYLARREHTAVTHPEWTPGHSHNDGLRIASKAILRDLWRESKRLHEATMSQEIAA